ncbi:efflux RND transporter permease subunit, partial [Roseovarius indicus]
GIIINDSIVLVTTIDEYAKDRGVIPSIIDGVADRLRPVMLTTLTTVLGLAPLLFERSQQAQFLKPTVITLVYGLGFGMVLVLLLVPSLIAIQHDLKRRTGALRRALSVPVASVRLAVVGALAAIVAWLAVTMGVTLVTGALPPVFTQALPMLAGPSPMVAALGLYLAGAMLIVLLVLIGAGLTYLVKQRQPAGQP